MSDDPNDRLMRAIGKVYAYKMVGGWLSTLPVAQVADNIKAEIQALEEEWKLGTRTTETTTKSRAEDRKPRRTRR